MSSTPVSAGAAANGFAYGALYMSSSPVSAGAGPSAIA
jgi:hypothetical protein